MEEAKTEKYLMIGIVALAIVFLALCGYLVYKSESVIKSENIQAQVHIISLERKRGPLPTSNASIIESWMTFDYVNYTFGLPSTYLKSQLNITDKRYPKVTLEEYAEDYATSTDGLLGSVQSAVKNYHK